MERRDTRNKTQNLKRVLRVNLGIETLRCNYIKDYTKIHSSYYPPRTVAKLMLLYQFGSRRIHMPLTVSENIDPKRFYIGITEVQNHFIHYTVI